jgi:hypothetical protein
MIGGDIINARFLCLWLNRLLRAGIKDKTSNIILSKLSILLQPYTMKITKNLEARRVNRGIKKKQSSA